MSEENILINAQAHSEFDKNRTEENLKRYVMSELLTPIEDMYHAMELVKNNMDLLTDIDLLCVASYLHSDWVRGDNIFLNRLNEKLPEVTDRDKAIIYYLNALDVESVYGKKERKEEYSYYLNQSIMYSKNMKFVNNLYDLAQISDADSSLKLMEQAYDNIEEVLTRQELLNKPADYWLTTARWIREFILGVSISDILFSAKFFNENIVEKRKN